jgi:DNA-binding SARP family transcriptional activator
MRVGILGPLVVRSAGSAVVPTAPKPRQVLALLAARPAQVVPVETMVDELWGNDPPGSALTAVRTYIVQLRHALAGALRTSTAAVAEEVLPHTGWGYRLVTDPGQSDANLFAHYAEQGRRALVAGENDRASTLLRRALGEWRGPALADVRAGPHLLAHRTLLEESRLGVVEQRVEADLRLGRHHELVDELAALVARHPLNEILYAMLMIALYRSGRTAAALGAYERLRGTLHEELGMDPSPRLRGLRDDILSALR